MYFIRCNILLGIGLILTVLDLTAARGADPTATAVKAAQKRVVGVLPFETSSISPDGGFRTGGSDARNYALSADGKSLVTEDAGGWQLESWDVDTGKSMGKFGRISDPVALALTPDGKSVITAANTNNEPLAVERWDLATKKRVCRLDEGVNTVRFTAIAVSADGGKIALAGSVDRRNQVGQAGIHLWDANGNEIAYFQNLPNDFLYRYFDCLAFSPDGKTLAYVSNQNVVLVEVATGKVRGQLGRLPPRYMRGDEIANRATSVAFSPDGRSLAVSSVDGMVRSWDILSGIERMPLAAHKGHAECVQFSPDGKSLFTYGQDNFVLTWTVADLRQLPPAADRLSATELTALWNDLGGTDRAALQEAIRRLAAAPQDSLPMLRQHLRPIPEIDAERGAQLAKAFTSDDYNARKKAAGELRKLGEQAIPLLIPHRNNDDSGRIAANLVQELYMAHPTDEQIQRLYGLVVLERINNDESRQLLTAVSKGAKETIMTREAQASLLRLPKADAAAPEKITKPDLLWDQLGKEEPTPAFEAICALAQRPSKAVPIMADKLRTIAARKDYDDSPEQIKRLLNDLNAEDFEVRNRASQELAMIGKRAERALRQELENSPALESKTRIEAILDGIEKPKLSLERLQVERALEVLELIGTAEARQVVEGLAEAKNPVGQGIRRGVTTAAAALSGPVHLATFIEGGARFQRA